jgi:tetratricopeptide (TPR) repeat protein
MNVLRSLLVAVLLCSCSTLRADQQWIEVDSPHFSIATDGGEKRAHDVATRFEQMRTAFGALFQKVSVNTAPLQIIAFRNNKELRQYAPLYGGKPVEVAGFFLGNGGHGSPGASSERQYIALDLSGEDNWGTVFHEYAHLLINSNFPPSPVWFDEGFAEYCSSLKIDKKQISLGLVKPELTEVLRENRWLKLVDLFRVGHDSKIYNRDDRRSVFYAQSWLTVHFLMTKGMMKQVAVYVRLSQDQHVPVPDAIRRAFGMEPEVLEKTVENYFRSGNAMYYHMPAPPGSDTISFTSHPLNDLDVKSVMADLDYHSRDYRQRGLTEFQEIIANQPDNVAANRALGYEALQKNDWEKAGEYFKRAVSHDVKDPQVHYLFALMLYRKGMSRNEDELATMKKELNTAIALEPDYADAYNLLGMTLSFAGDENQAVTALTKAITLNPRNSYYTGNLANAYLRARDFDHAVPLLQQLQNSPEPQIAAMAAQQLQQIQNYRSAMSRQPASGDVRVETSSGSVDSDDDSPKSSEPAPDAHSVDKSQEALSMKGTLVSVDCSTRPVFNVASGGKNWKLSLSRNQPLQIKGDFKSMGGNPCTLKNRTVTVTYRKTGETQGEILSLQLE